MRRHTHSQQQTYRAPPIRPPSRAPHSGSTRRAIANWKDLSDADPVSAVNRCKEVLAAARARSRATTYKALAVALKVYWQLKMDGAERKRFAKEIFAKDDIPLETLLRAVLIGVHGNNEEGRARAGTDATALQAAIRSKLHWRDLPEYIKRQGGIDKMIRAERARTRPSSIKPRPKQVALTAPADEIERLMDIAPDDEIWVRLKKSESNRFVILRIKPV